MAAAQVLSTPELVSSIFQCLEEQEKQLLVSRENRRALLNAALVNKIWFEAATNVLWTYEQFSGPGLEDFEAIEPDRRQIYASKLQSVQLQDDSDDVKVTRSLSFSRLKNVSVSQLGYRGGPTIATLKQWLVPSIESVNFRDWSTGFDKSFLQTLKTQCPRLRSIALERVKSGISSQDLNSFFRNSSLENIRLYMEGMPNEKVLVNDELLSTLSELKGLKSLNVISQVGLEVVESVLFKLGPTGFQDLRKLHLMLERPAVETAFKIFKNASKVSFNIASWNDEKMSMFTTLKHMKNLKELSIAFEATRTYLHGKDLFWLSALKQLKKLNISPRQPGHDKIILDSFADVDLQVIFSGLPQLQHLGFLLDVDFPIEALKRLSRSSPKLEEASFSKSWDLKALEDVPGCLFPELQILSLYKPYISTTTNIKPGKLARSLCQHVPKLRDLNFEKDREDRVLCAWEKLSGRKSSIAATKQMESQILLRELMLQHGGNIKMMSGFGLPM
ncbi:hypothetical protein E4T43_09426 [Aureobasidium subglaciale]|nr:hypothetical protein E4T43_09426 [Aureobasidium subglaciale]